MVNQSRRQMLFGRSVSSLPTPIRLPWSVVDARFVDLCTRCGECVAACPEHVIERGDGGFPQLNFQHGECTFCQSCVDCCEQPLFQMDQVGSPAQAWSCVAQIESDCLAHQGVYCQNCKDACEQRAIVFSHRIGTVPQPSVVQEDCVACGACVAPCPSGSIHIVSNTSSGNR